MWFCCTSGSPIGRLDAPQRQQRAALDAEIASRCARAAPRCSSRDPCRLMMRQSETRRLMYCQSCSWNSGWLRICLNTLMSGSTRAIARCQVAAEMPFAMARARKPSRHSSKPGGAARSCVGNADEVRLRRAWIEAGRGGCDGPRNQLVSWTHSSGNHGRCGPVPGTPGTGHRAAFRRNKVSQSRIPSAYTGG